MKKRMLSLFMCFVMCLSLCPTAAWAQDDAAHEHDHAAETSLSDQLSETFVEPEPESEPAPAAEPETTPEPTPETTPAAEPESEPEPAPESEPVEEPETTPAAEPESEPTPAPTAAPEEDSTADEAVQAVQTLIDALPTADTVTAADYDAVQAAYDAYEALTPEQQTLITGAEIFEVLFGWFNAQTEPLTGVDPVEISFETAFKNWLSGDTSPITNAKLVANFAAIDASLSAAKENYTYILDLNGFDLNQYAYNDYTLSVENTAELCLENKGSTASTIYYVLHVHNGRTLTVKAESADINVYSSIQSTASDSKTAGCIVLAGNNGHKITLMSEFTEIDDLKVSGSVTLQGGSYGSITVTDSGTVANLLPEGDQFYETNTSKLVNASRNTVSNVTVSACRHTDANGDWAFGDDYKCTVCGAACTHTNAVGGSAFKGDACEKCGKTCAHETIGEDGVCAGCGLSHVAKFTTSEGTTTWKTTLWSGDEWYKGQTGTLTLLKDIDQVVSMESNSNAPTNITLDLNGKSIKAVKMDSESGKLTIQDTSESAGQIDTLTVISGETTLASGKVVKLYVSAGSAILEDTDGIVSQDSTGKLIVTGGEITGALYYAGTVTYSGDGVTGSTLTKTFDGLTKVNVDDDYSITVTVTSDNYADATAGVSVTITDKAKRQMSVSMTGWAYGQTANEPQYTKPTDAADATPVVTYKSTAEGAESTTTVPTDAGDYTVTVKLETDTMVYSGSANFTISKADIPDAEGYQAPKAKTGLSYTGVAQALFDDAVIPEGCKLFYRVEGVTQENVWGSWASDTDLMGTNADTYTIHWFIKGNDNYNDYGGFSDPREMETTIDPAVLTPSITGASKVYDGTIDADEENITVEFEGLQNGEKLEAGTDYTVTASYDSTDAGTGKTVAAALSLIGDKAANYCFGEDETSANVTTNEGVITKAPAPDTTPGTLTVYNKLETKYYDFNFEPLLPTPKVGQTLGTVSWRILTTSKVGDTKYYDSINYDPKTGQGEIQILNINSETEGQVATMSVPVTSENFQNFTLTIKVMAVNRKALTGDPTLSEDEIDYGEALRDITLSGTMTGPDGEAVEGTFAWDTPDAKPNAGTNVQANWSFTPNDTAYTEASGSASITVNKAAVPEDMFTAPEARELTYNKSAQELVTAGTSNTALGSILYSLDKTADSWSAAVPQQTNAGSYTVYWYIPESTNYQSFGSAEQPREIAVSIAKADLTPDTDFYAPTANALTFNGTQQTLLSVDNVFTAENDELAGNYHVEYLQSSGDFGNNAPTGFDADTYSVSYRIEPDNAATANYNGYEAETPIQVTIAPLNLKTAFENSGDGSRIAGMLNETLTFTGSAQTQTVTLMLKNAVGDVVSDVCTLTADTDYTLANNTQTNASTDYELSVTGAGNYTGSIKLSWSIAKADHSALSDVNVVRKYTRTDAQSVDLSALLNANAGKQTYVVGSDLPQGVTAVMQEDGKTLSITITGKTADDVGGKITIPVTIGSDNYNDASVNVVVTITAKDVPTITPGTLTKTYDGKPLEAGGKAMFENAEVAGKWSWKESSTTGGREIKKPTDVADSKAWVLVFTPDDAANYAAVETPVQVSIAKRSVAFESADIAREYDGTELTNGDTALKLTEGSMADGQSFTIAFTGSQTDIGRSDNSFEVSSSKTADIENYDIDTTFGELRVKLPADVGSKTRQLTKDNVTSDDREDVEETQTTVDAYLAMEPSTDENDNEKKTLEDLKKHVEELLQQLDDAKAAMQSETITKVDNIDKTNAKASDKPALEAAKAAIEKALEDFDGNYTEAEKTELNEKLARIKAALAALAAQEKAEKLAVRTGDEAKPVLWVLVLVAALAAVVVILIVRRKKK